jgi:hypothetical protein
MKFIAQATDGNWNVDTAGKRRRTSDGAMTADTTGNTRKSELSASINQQITEGK